MKKYLFPIFLSTLIGTAMAYLLISSYDDIEPVSLSKDAEDVYYIQSGVYSNKDEMLEDMTMFENYIYNVEDNMYYTYFGITKNEKNEEKIKEFYKQKGYDTSIRKKVTDNTEFLTILGQYDDIIKNTDDSNTISVVCNQVLSKYEEMVAGEY
ncbi:MAG: hypothetical protein IJ093_02425 [Bacilli bacterium]|nr:hypothetical protein [Bacilli bacterium]